MLCHAIFFYLFELNIQIHHDHLLFYSYISYLPLAHIYERFNQILVAYYGGAVGFYQGVCGSLFLSYIFVGCLSLSDIFAFCGHYWNP